MAPPPPVDSAATFDITLMQGSDYSKPFTLDDGADTPTPYDLTGVTCAAEIRAEFGGALLETFTATVTDAVNGEITISLTDVQTGALAGDGGINRNNATPWVWDLELTYTGGEKYRWIQGTVRLSQEATES